MNFYVYQLIHLVGWLRFDPHNPKGNWYGCLTIVASQVDINVRTAQTFHLSAKDKRMKEVRGLRDSVQLLCSSREHCNQLFTL
ncbi:hypothetical protein FGO68_gene13039 [Halteria grandinella]|uniref:Uncharacterized protein n=1 Tax=Halteria grandinella TaxID=5974 RepID=A0A8J8NU81_HALGN|nr:hypothetical protein FGO68_gene13039 [Halteria grandinella]